MGVLANAQQEAFCQAFVRLRNASKAAAEAGYSGGPKGKNHGVRGSVLMKNKAVAKRIAELDQALTKTATKRAQLDRSWVLDRLKDNAEDALQRGDRSAANRALELLGKEIGMFVDRKQILVGPLEALDATRLQRLLLLAEAAEAGLLELPRADAMNPESSTDPIDIAGEIIEGELVDVPEEAEPVPEAEDDDVLG